MSIYTNLFKYRPRPTRTPHEDFLTAALADILNRVPREISVKFVADILLAGHEKRQFWLDFIDAFPAAVFRWATQIGVRHRQGGIVDLLLLVEGKETIVIENKIGAVVRPHEGDLAEGIDAEADAEAPTSVPAADANQLRTYGAWLATRCKGQPWPGALILLTHYSVAPMDFGGPTPGEYGVPILQVCRWGAIWRWAKQIGSHALSNDVSKTHPDWVNLCHELAEFLEEEDMTSDSMTLHDLAAAEMFVSSADRIDRTFEVVRKALGPVKDGLAAGNFHGPHYYGSAGVVLGWFYMRAPPKIKNNWHFMWGIRFPFASEWWLDCNPPLPQVPHVFLALTTEGSEFPLSALKPRDIPAGWQITPVEEDLVIAKPLHEFRADPEGLAIDFSEWAAAAMKSALPMLALLIKGLV